MYLHPHDLLPADLHGVPTHPYPLYELVADGILLLGLWLGRDRLKQPGQMFLSATIGYGVIRFSLTFFRQETIVLWGLQEAQVFAIGTAILASMAYAGRFILQRQARRTSSPGGFASASTKGLEP